MLVALIAAYFLAGRIYFNASHFSAFNVLGYSNSNLIYRFPVLIVSLWKGRPFFFTTLIIPSYTISPYLLSIPSFFPSKWLISITNPVNASNRLIF